MNKVSIRKFKIADYQAVIKLWQKADLPYRPKGRDSRENINRQIKQANTIYLVAELDGKIVGAVFGTHDSRKGYINRLAVLPEFQNHGIGQRLVKELEKEFDKHGIGIITCLIEDWNKTSLQFFEKIGYKKHPDITYFSKRKKPTI